MNTRRLAALWFVAAVLAGIAALRLQLTYDLAFFLPPPQTPEQAVLTERLGLGAGANTLFVSLGDTPPERAAQIADQLRTIEGVSRVLPDDTNPALSELPEILWQNRLLLTDLPASADAWLRVLADRTSDLAFADPELTQLIAADPHLGLLSLLDSIAGDSAPELTVGDARYLVVQTTAEAFDLDRQEALLTELQSKLEERDEVLGTGAYGVAVRDAVQLESAVFSTLASLALLVLLYARFRQPGKVLSVAAPLALGAAAGALALSLFFDEVHGITLAFGFTLLGVTIDYPLHVLSHENHARQIVPTLRIGILSTLVAYAAFWLAGSTGLAQLGTFAVTGIVTAALATLALIPPTTRADKPPNTIPVSANHWPWLIVLPVACVLPFSQNVFSDDLARLTPVPADRLARDAQVRETLELADLRYVIAHRAPTLDEALQATETTTRRLRELEASGVLAGLQSPTDVLPSLHTQQERRAALAGAMHAFRDALARTEFRPGAFNTFTDTVSLEAERDDWLRLDELKAAPEIYANLDAAVYPSEDHWVTRIFLRQPTDIAALKSTAEATGAMWVDLKATSEELVASYRHLLIAVLAAAFVVVAALVAILTRDLRRTIWILGSVLAAVAAALSLSYLRQAGLSLFDLVALALVAGLGLDYALFFSRAKADPADADRDARAVLLCAASSVLVFGLLALSSIPVLRGIGTTVACGVIVAYALARFGVPATSRSR